MASHPWEFENTGIGGAGAVRDQKAERLQMKNRSSLMPSSHYGPVVFAVCLGIGNVMAKDLPQPLADFYQQYPVYQTFFPFGLYGGVQDLGWGSNHLRYM